MDSNESNISSEENEKLNRPQRRLLRRMFNGRTEPLVIHEHPFLTYKEASQYLSGLTAEERDSIYGYLKADQKQRDTAHTTEDEAE